MVVEMLTEKERLEAVNQATQLALALQDKEAMQVCLKEYVSLLTPRAVLIDNLNTKKQQETKKSRRGCQSKLTDEQIRLLYALFDEGLSPSKIRNSFMIRFGRTITEQTVFNYKNKWRSEVKKNLPIVTSIEDRPDY